MAAWTAVFKEGKHKEASREAFPPVKHPVASDTSQNGVRSPETEAWVK